MSVKLLTEHHSEFLSSKGGCTGSSESTLVKMLDCWISHVVAQLLLTSERVFMFTLEMVFIQRSGNDRKESRFHRSKYTSMKDQAA